MRSFATPISINSDHSFVCRVAQQTAVLSNRGYCARVTRALLHEHYTTNSANIDHEMARTLADGENWVHHSTFYATRISVLDCYVRVALRWEVDL